MLGPRLRTRPTSARVARVVSVLGLLVGIASCGGGRDVSADQRQRLEAALSFLRTDHQLTSEQVGCVREQLERRLDAADLGDLDLHLRQIDAGTLAIEDLPRDQGEILVSAIATCAVAG